MKADAEEAWLFDFCLEGQNGKPLDRKVADNFFNKIVEWAEQQNLQIGGGYRAPRKEDLQ